MRLSSLSFVCHNSAVSLSLALRRRPWVVTPGPFLGNGGARFKSYPFSVGGIPRKASPRDGTPGSIAPACRSPEYNLALVSNFLPFPLVICTFGCFTGPVNDLRVICQF